MRKVIFCALVCVVFFSCRKEAEAASLDLQGVWEVRQASGTITTNYAPGNGNTIRFSGDSYEMRTNGQFLKSGTFKVVQDGSVAASTCLDIPSSQYKYRIIYDNDADSRKVFLELKDDDLFFISGCYSYDAGSTAQYKRIN